MKDHIGNSPEGLKASVDFWLNELDMTLNGVTNNMTVEGFVGLYNLIDQVYIRVHPILADNYKIKIHMLKARCWKVIEGLLFRAGEDDETGAPTLRDMYVLLGNVKELYATLTVSLQDIGYFFEPKKDNKGIKRDNEGMSGVLYDDPMLDYTQDHLEK